MSSFNKFGVIFLSFAFFSSYQLFGQSDTTKAQFKKYAVQFQISSSFTLRSFQGALISFKRNLSNKTALRIGIDLRSNFGNTKEEGYLSTNDSTVRDRKIDRHDIDVGLISQFIFDFTKDNISVFVGGGPLINYSHSKNNENYRIPLENESKYSAEAWNVGFSFPIGVEWYFRNNMSLSAEYGLLVYYQFQKEERKIYTSDSDFLYDSYDTKMFYITPSNVLFGLSIYF